MQLTMSSSSTALESLEEANAILKAEMEERIS